MNARNRLYLLLAGLLSLILVVAAACGDDDDGDDGDGEDTPAAGQTTTTGDGDRAPADQQQVTLQLGEPQYLDPHRSSFEQDIAIIRTMFRGLYNLTDNGEGGVDVVPAMAADMPEVNGSVYTVRLKEGLMWSDGQPLTAQHFVDGAKRGCNPQVATDYGYIWGPGYLDLQGCGEWQSAEDPAAPGLADALAVRAVDDTTIEYTLNQPNDRFTMLMALWMTFPVRQELIDQFGDAWTSPENIVVNGPYILTEYNAGEGLVLEPNENWSGEAPALQRIEVRFLDNLSAAFTAYQNGELDITRIAATDIAVAEGDSALADEVLINPSGRITSLQMNMANAPLDNLDVRLALARAIDRETLNDVVFEGTNTPATYWVVPGVEGHQGNEAFDDIIGFDPDAARQHLADAGYEGGAGFPTLTIVVHNDDYQRTAEFLQQQFQEILGINLEINRVDSQTRSQIFRDETFELFIGGWQLDYPDIENPLFGLFETDGGNNHYNCSHPDVDAALERALAATSEEERIAAYQDMETAIITNVCGVAPMWNDSLPYMVRSNLGGIVPNGTIDAGWPGSYCVECWYVKAE
ncbi:MAG TPA: peptide ABC transporter substrate-binding protein [Dehalococcoidia bacterium]|nr:peptide ABC transporter substrate-binding protein [Dehalococcoidia bacterium]